jgi:hypothetical protein
VRDDLDVTKRAASLLVTGGKGNMFVDNRLLGRAEVDADQHYLSGNKTR